MRNKDSGLQVKLIFKGNPLSSILLFGIVELILVCNFIRHNVTTAYVSVLLNWLFTAILRYVGASVLCLTECAILPPNMKEV